MSSVNGQCQLEHDRPRRAVIRVVVKSSRLGRPGHPMHRDVAVCASHARQLQEMGFQVVSWR